MTGSPLQNEGTVVLVVRPVLHKLGTPAGHDPVTKYLEIIDDPIIYMNPVGYCSTPRTMPLSRHQLTYFLVFQDVTEKMRISKYFKTCTFMHWVSQQWSIFKWPHG